MKCFVTGAGGFVGSALLPFLKQQGHEASGVFSRIRPGPGASLPACDLLDYGSLADLVGACQPELVFHLAALSNPSQSWRQPREFYENNLQGTVHLLEAVRTRCPQARVLLVSSSHVYAPPLTGQKLHEGSPLANPNPYACSKRMAELAGENYRSSFGLQVITARPFNHSGPGQPESFVISDFCRQVALLEQRAKKEGPSAIGAGNLAPVRDFLDVRDVVRAYLLLALKGQVGQTYNVCSGQGTSIQAILDIVLSMARIKAPVRQEPGRLRKQDQMALVGDNSKLSKAGFWRPRISLQQMVADTLQHWRQEIRKGRPRGTEPQRPEEEKSHSVSSSPESDSILKPQA